MTMADYLSEEMQVQEIGRLGNYGPGGYTNTCWDCGRPYIGAKLSRQCLGCAVKWANEQIHTNTWQGRNINDYVKVKLTDLGREQIIKNHNALFGENAHKYPVDMPKPDADGWCTMQLWHVMREFGEHMGNGRPAMIDTEIQFGIRSI